MKLRTRILRPFATAWVALLVTGSAVALGGCTTSQAQLVPTATALPPEVTTPIPMATEVTIQIAGAMATQVPVPTVLAPTAEPIPAAPDTGAAVAGAELGSATFEGNELSGWSFGQLYADGVGDPTWKINGGALSAPSNEQSINPFNDTFAISPFSISGNGGVAVSAFSQYASKIGIIIGYQDSQNYVAAIFGSESAPGLNGITILQMSKGKPSIVAQNKGTLMSLAHWHLLRVAIKGTTITASVANTTVTATLTTPLAGQRVGLYAGSEGFVRFDNLRVVAN